MDITTILAAGFPKELVMTISVASGALVGAVLFVVLFLRARPPKPVERVSIVKGPSAGQGVAIKGRVRIGRDEANDIAIDDDELSRFHCEIRNDSGTAVLIDMQSSNGTHLNGKQVASSMLRPGDEIMIGRNILRCS